jgi:hypothetical protein
MLWEPLGKIKEQGPARVHPASPAQSAERRRLRECPAGRSVTTNPKASYGIFKPRREPGRDIIGRARALLELS